MRRELATHTLVEALDVLKEGSSETRELLLGSVDEPLRTLLTEHLVAIPAATPQSMPRPVGSKLERFLDRFTDPANS